MEPITSRTKAPEQVNDLLCSRTLKKRCQPEKRVVKSLYKGYLYNVNNRDDFIKSNEIQVFTLPRITSSY